MEMYLKFTAGLLLMVHAFHVASLQDSTDSPGRTINQNWLRDLPRNKTGRQNAAVAEEESEDDRDLGASAMESSNDYGGIASGSMVLSDGEEENLFSRETAENKTSDDLNAVTTTLPQALPNGETEQPELWNATVSPATQATNSSQVNVTEAEEESQNSTAAPQTSTAHWIAPNATSSPDSSNGTGLQSTTSAPESDATQASTTEPGGDVGSSNSTTPMATTEAPRENETPVTPSSTTAVPPESAETSPLPPASDAPITPEKANKTDKDGAAGSSADRGVASDSHRSSSNSWGAVLGTAVAVALVGLVAYVILKKKQQKAFSHRKLVEEFPSDPVLRLDNSEPLDLNFGRAAYFNPGLQGDNIQMSNFP
ncbi:mucin-15 [Scophthalmus maximus]|nr:mucin-15 [Scophthalmus maximus]